MQTGTAGPVTGSMNNNQGHREGPLARSIEEMTAKLPSDCFLWTSLAAMGTSITLKALGRKHTALFVGQWAAPFLLLGIYNKLVKLGGHDQEDRGSGASSPSAFGPDLQEQ